jgi:hypothetical protein
MRPWCLALAVAALACSDASGPPPYVPEPLPAGDDAAPSSAQPTRAPADAGGGLLGEDHTVVECVKACVQDRQMRAESIESIRAGCVRQCERRCRQRCIERSKQRGLSTKGLRGACTNTCRFD